MEELLKINNKLLDNYIQNLVVEWYDISSENSLVNAKGDLTYLPINQKYKITVTTKPMTKSELIDFFSVVPMERLTCKYFNPYTGGKRTTQVYRGDRSVSFYWNREDEGVLYEPMKISFIEI